MSGFQDRFKRREKKYRIDEQQYRAVRDYLAHTMRPDDHGSCEVLSLYYDTRLFQLIEHSISKPTYKEKLRIRSYGVPEQDACIFIEIKKKYRGVVYKRRVPASPRAASHSWRACRSMRRCGAIPSDQTHGPIKRTPG